MSGAELDLLALLISETQDYAILMLDPEGNVATWNAGAQRFKGYEAREIIGRHFSVFYPREDVAAGKPARELVVAAADGRLEDEGWRVRKDGTRFWANVVITALRDEDGTLRGYGKVTRDLTERREQELRLIESEERFRLMVESVEDYAILMLDPEGNVATWNAGAQRFKGYEAREIIGRHFSVFYPREDVAAGKPARELVVAAADGRLEDEGWRVRKDGTRFWANVVITALRDEDGTLRGYGKVTRDLTERREQELRLIAAHAEAMEASRLKSEFVANMSHEIRTPLNGLIGMSGLLLDTQLDDEQREYVDAVRVSGDALMAVITDVLDFSKIEAGKLEIEDEPFELRPLVEDVCSLVATAAHTKGVEVMSRIEIDVSPVVSGDGNRVRQVLTNLATNAVKFTPKGEITVRVTAEAVARERIVLRFEVKDTGIGIEPASLERIFDSFAQQDGSTTRRFGGTGLGLAISKQLVELMGGEIGVRSSPGEGSTFWFTVSVRSTPDRLEPLEPPRFAGVRVLVVDDNATSLILLKRQLTSWDLECDTTTDPTAVTGLLNDALAAGRAYRLVLLDSSMPVMSGDELTRVIRTTPATSSLPVVMLTSSSGGRRAATDAGVDAFVTKPIHAHRLLGEIERGLRPRPEEKRDREAASPVSAQAGVPVDGPLVLVAEDNQINQRVAVALLRKRGLRVHVARNGREAVEMSERADYEAVFMDCQMPELDGYQATEAIRGHERPERHVPIVAMTANTMTGDRERCLTAGMDDYISKPIRIEDLDGVLARVLSGRVAGPTAEPDGAGAGARRRS